MTSFKLVAVIEEQYRDYFDKLLTKVQYEKNFEEYNSPNCLYKYVDFLYGSGGFFDVKKKYSKKTGILVCGYFVEDKYPFRNECEGCAVDFCIKKAILPFGEIIEYYSHNKNICPDCDCELDNFMNMNFSFNNKKSFYLNKYKTIIESVLSEVSSVSSLSKYNNMKKLLKEDIKSILERYSDYNFDLTELNMVLENL